MSEEYLYHYTTIPNLALILKNRTLRLNSLDRMDDLQETKSNDLQNFGKFVYASSWTDIDKEVIPMWRMYTKPQIGVRIGLHKNPFKIYDDSLNQYRDPTLIEIEMLNTPSSDKVIPAINTKEEKYANCNIADYGMNTHLHKVYYTDDNVLLLPNVGYHFDRSLLIDYTKIGKYKNTYWAFQNEWRYIVTAEPHPFSGGLDEVIINIKDGTAKQILPYIDMYISDNALDNMKILLAPDISDGNRVLLESLVEKYNPNAKIQESQLKGLLNW